METLPVICMKCGFCTAKNHCAACGAELTEALRSKPGISGGTVNLMDHTLSVEHSLDPDGLEDLLDGLGLMIG